MEIRSFKGFTLLELMITIGILGVLAAIAIPAYNGYIKTSHTTECNNEVAAIKLAETEYYLDTNSYFGGASPGISGVTNIKNASNGIYTPTNAAASAASECNYNVTSTATSYTITATGAAGGHLTSGATIVQITGP